MPSPVYNVQAIPIEKIRANSYNPLTESPHLFQHDGLWYLFITTSSGQPISFFTSLDPTGPLEAWTYRGRLRNVLGYDTSYWFASEFLRDGTHDYFSWVAGDRIEFREMKWNDVANFQFLQPAYLHVTDLAWSSSVVSTDSVATLSIVTVNPTEGYVDLEAVLVDDQGIETPVSLDSLGIPSHHTPQDDTTRVYWTPQRFPRVPDDDTVTVTRIRVRTTDHTAETPVLTIRAPSARPAPDPLDDPSSEPDVFGFVPPGLRGPGGVYQWNDIVMRFSRPTHARVSLFDISGRRVGVLADREMPRGVTRLRWDGRDGEGRAMSRGVYFVRLEADGRARSRRLVLMR